MSKTIQNNLTTSEERWVEQSIWRGKISKGPFTIWFLIFASLPHITYLATGDELWMGIALIVYFIHWGLITKRLRDLNRPTWHYIWCLIPVYGIIFLISELMLKPSVNNAK